MKTALLVLAFLLSITILIVGMQGLIELRKITATLSQAPPPTPIITTTTIEYLEVTAPDGVRIGIRGLCSEIDSRILLLWAEAQ